MIHNFIWRLDLMADLRKTALKLLYSEACISELREWLIYNRLLINDSKTEFLVVGPRHQLLKIAIDSITVGDSTVQPLDSVRNLGSWFDSNMSMSIHIGEICSNTFHGLYKIRQIRKFLSPESTKTLVHAFVTSHLEYCNSLLFGVPKYQTDRLQKVLNATARLSFGFQSLVTFRPPYLIFTHVL